MAKTGHFCFLLDTLAPRWRSLHLGGPETLSEKFLLRLGEPLHLGVVLLRLGQATVPVLFFLRLILESITLLFGLPVDPTQSTSRHDSLLNEKKMWVDFRILKNLSSRRNSFSLESPLTLCCYFIKGKTK